MKMQKGLDAVEVGRVGQTMMAKPRAPEKSPKLDQRKNVWFHPDQLAKLAALAKDEGRSLSDVIRRLVETGFDFYELWLSKPILQRVRARAEAENRSVGEMIILLLKAGLDDYDLRSQR
jgi:predicted CopG family antitoxin